MIEFIPLTRLEKIAPQEIQNRYSQLDSEIVDKLLIKFMRKGEIEMAETRYVILNYDGDNFEAEKATIENIKSSKTEIADLKLRIEKIKEHIQEENKQIAEFEVEIAELEKIAQIADEKKAEEEAKAKELAELETTPATAETIVGE